MFSEGLSLCFFQDLEAFLMNYFTLKLLLCCLFRWTFYSWWSCVGDCATPALEAVWSPWRITVSAFLPNNLPAFYWCWFIRSVTQFRWFICPGGSQLWSWRCLIRSEQQTMFHSSVETMTKPRLCFGKKTVIKLMLFNWKVWDHWTRRFADPCCCFRRGAEAGSAGKQSHSRGGGDGWRELLLSQLGRTVPQPHRYFCPTGHRKDHPEGNIPRRRQV